MVSNWTRPGEWGEVDAGENRWKVNKIHSNPSHRVYANCIEYCTHLCRIPYQWRLGRRGLHNVDWREWRGQRWWGGWWWWWWRWQVYLKAFLHSKWFALIGFLLLFICFALNVFDYDEFTLYSQTDYVYALDALSDGHRSSRGNMRVLYSPCPCSREQRS